MKVLIITADKCDDSELLYPYYRLIEENYEVDIASFDKRKISAKHYFEIEADISVNDLKFDDYDALFLPGGLAPEKLRQNGAVLSAVKYFNEKNKPIAAICHGQQILISSGILKGKKATCYPGIRDDLLNCGANYIDQRAVVDGNLVTSRRPEDLPYFMKEFLRVIQNYSTNI